MPQQLWERYRANLSKYLLPLGLSVIVLTLVYLIYGFYWEDYERWMASAIYGGMCSPAYDAWFEDGLVMQFPALSVLSAHFDTVPVYGIWHLIILVLHVTIWFHLCLRVLRRRIKNKALLIFLTLLFVFSIIGLCLVYVNVNRDSILLASGSLLLYLDYYLYDHRRSWAFAFLFLFSCLIRVIGGTLVLILFSLLFLLVSRSIRRTTDLLKIHWALAFACFLLVQVAKHTADNTGRMIENTYEYALQDRGDVVPLSEMKTRPDSVRYTALTTYFLINDSAQINPAFIRRVVDIDRYLILGINQEDISHLSESLNPLRKAYEAILILFYVILLILILRCDRKTIVNIVAVNVFGWLVVAGLAMKVDVTEHFFLPWVSMLFGTSLFLIAAGPWRFMKRQIIPVVILLLVAIGAENLKLAGIKANERENNKKTHAYLRKLEVINQNYTPVMWDYAQVYFPSELLLRSHPDPLQNCIYQTMFYPMYRKFGQDRCLKRFGFSPLDWRNMNISFHRNREKLKFIMEPGMADFLGDYYKTLYGMDFTLVRDSAAVEIVPGYFIYDLQGADTIAK